MTKPELEGNRLGHPEMSYADRLARKGTPGSPTAADGSVHWRGVPCPGPDARIGHPDRYLSTDEHMWLALHPPLDLQKVGVVLATAFPKREWNKS